MDLLIIAKVLERPPLVQVRDLIGEALHHLHMVKANASEQLDRVKLVRVLLQPLMIPKHEA